MKAWSRQSLLTHLHFEMHDPEGAAVDPYESLLAASQPGQVSPVVTAPAADQVIVPRGDALINYDGSSSVYLLAANVKYPIADEYTFLALNFKWSDIVLTPGSSQFSDGALIKLQPGSVAVYPDGSLVALATQSADKYSYVFTQYLAIGSRGREVSELQKILKDLGYFTYPSITDYFGPLTKEAVMAFQRAKAISPVGVVGPQTRAALNAL